MNQGAPKQKVFRHSTVIEGHFGLAFEALRGSS